ncbi:MAG: calcium/sodium antiporter [Bacteroidales bacterium]|nr:calcium/sodium antiporter [Bacteroidales bacterium]
MLLDIVFLIVGLGLIMLGANMLTDGASAIARRRGVSDLIVGLTVVAFGTSAPELVISIVSAIHGSPELAIGNVVGSNIFNVLVIIGVTSMIMPMKIDRTIMTKDIPLVVLSALALLAIGNGRLLDGDAVNEVSRVDGILLLLFFAIFMRHTFSTATDGALPDPGAESEAAGKPVMSMGKSVLWVLIGLGGLVFGGDRFVSGASGIASGLGVSDAVIGLTIVAAGTSLPELATSVTAAVKGKPGIALGNVIGSNIFNIFLVLGSSAVIRPLPFGSIGNLDLLVLTVACVLFWVFGWIIGHRTITRGEGAVLTAGYVAYVTWLVINA